MKYILILCLMFSFGCADDKTINGRHYETYGLFNVDEAKDRCVNYTISIGNVVWSIILIETIFMPVYFIGYSLYEPSAQKECTPNL